MSNIKIAVGGLEHETAGFLDGNTKLDEFLESKISKNEIIQRVGTSNTVVDGYISGIKKVYFGAYSQSLETFEFKKKKFHKGLDGHLYYGGINEKKCEQLLKKFFKQIR